MGMTNVGNLLELRRIYSRGITGKGITTAVLDTGIYAHPDFFIPRNKIVYFQDLIGVAVLDTGIFPHIDFGSRISVFRDFTGVRRSPYDDNGHGTHVSGIIASGGRLGDGSGIGVAPESGIVMLKVLEKDGSGKIKNMLKGMEWILLNHEKYGIRIVNISVGMPVKNIENPEEEEAKNYPVWKCLLLMVAGGVLVVKGSDFAVSGATEIARYFGMSERFIGLTIVAFGTSLPELVTSVAAARRGNSDIAVGNIVGSNLFNIMFVVGITAVIVPVVYQPTFRVDSIVAVAAAVLLLVCVYRGRVLKRRHGLLMLACYGGYFAYLLLV